MKKHNLFQYICLGIIIGILAYYFYSEFVETYQSDDPMLHLLKDILRPVHPVVNSLKLYKGQKSYTINKDKIYLCLYDENGDYYEINTLLHVLLHEISHKLNNYDVGHTEAFYKVFDDLQDKATKLGIFNPSIPIVKNYCGGS